MDEKIYFEFLQVATGNRTKISVSLSDSDWKCLFAFCKRQALIGVGFTAVERLYKEGIECPMVLKMQWLALTFKIEKQNEKLNRQCIEIVRQYENDGIQCCILKGQSNLFYYPKMLGKRRQSGDIDLWAKNVEYDAGHERKSIIKYVKLQHKLAGNHYRYHISYHHINAPNYNGTSIEVHFRPTHLYPPYRNWILQKWFKEHTDECMNNRTHIGFSIPTSSVNVVFQMIHMYKHYIGEGIGMRHLMDYYYTLKVWYNDIMECGGLQSKGMCNNDLSNAIISKEEIMHILKSFGMAQFSAAIMYVLNVVFSIPATYYLCEPNEKEGRNVLDEIMHGGNFGQYAKERPDVYKHRFKYHIWRLQRLFKLFISYPEEVLWEPVFRGYLLIWRTVH